MKMRSLDGWAETTFLSPLEVAHKQFGKGAFLMKPDKGVNRNGNWNIDNLKYPITHTIILLPPLLG